MFSTAMRDLLCTITLIAAIALSIAHLGVAAPRRAAHNIVLFVPDGLRALAVTPENAPTIATLRDHGVAFANPHSLFPTYTTPNASAMATGHFYGDTGNFSNTIYAVAPIRGAQLTVTPFLENDAALEDMDRQFGGDYLSEETILQSARRDGFQTATVGKLGPALIFDHTDRTGEPTVVIDDSTGRPGGIPVSTQIREAMTDAGLPLEAPSRGDNGNSGSATAPGTLRPNIEQQDYFVDVTTRVILPSFKKSGRPFVLVFWSRDPDGSQHNQGDSLNQLVPGINGPTSRAAIHNADADLARIEASLAALKLSDTTDIIVTADHGFSTISKQSATSAAAHGAYTGVPREFLPPGFLAIDLAAALNLPLFDPDHDGAPVGQNSFPRFGNGLLGPAAKRPAVIVTASGGSDLVYVARRDRALTARIVEILEHQDYVSGIFVDDAAGAPPGTLPLSAINLRGRAKTPRPTVVVSFRSFATDCGEPLLCAVDVADSTLQQGQGTHGSFSRADTMNFMAARGPDFKAGFVDRAPTSNADIGRTVAHLLGLNLRGHGTLVGRVLTEALAGGVTPSVQAHVARATPDATGVRTELAYQQVGATRYFDAGGTPDRTVGLSAGPSGKSPDTAAQRR